jgi:hypothetical protein
MKIKTAEATGQALDWLVATCEKHDNLRINPHAFDDALIMDGPQGNGVYLSYLDYSTNWSQGGPIIERERISPRWSKFWKCWEAVDPNNAQFNFIGDTFLIAAMRAYVASKLGDEVEIPEELK